MRYLAHFFFSALFLSSALAGFNWWVDPYGIYHKEANGDIPLRIMNERIFKTVRLAHEPADVVFIGTSRTDIGIGREQTTLPGKQLINLAIFDQRIHETRRLLEMVMQDGKHHTVVVGLDFFAFNALNATTSDYVEENYSSLRPAILLLSISSLSDAIAKLRRPKVNGGDCCYTDGFRLPADTAYLQGNYHHRFTLNERSYLMEKYLPYPQCAFSFAIQGHEAQSSLMDFQAILELAQRRHIDLRLFISPSHARQWETLAAANLWDTWETWKRQLVALNEQEAKQADRPPFPLWDFSGYDTVSMEDLPDEGTPLLMNNYTDSAHFAPAVGQRIVAQIFDKKDSWGVLLDHSNINAHLAKIQAGRLRYRTQHSNDVAEIEALARDTAHTKHCPQ